MNRILLNVFILLLFVAGSELFYLFGLNSAKKNSPTRIDNRLDDVQEITPSINKSSNIPLLKDHQLETLKSMARIKEDVVDSSIVKNVFSGKIKTIYTTNKEIQDVFYLREHYDYAIKIAGKNGGINTFFYTNDELKKAKVFEIVKGERSNSSLASLKVSDMITIEQELNLLKKGTDNNSLLISSSIIKGNQ